MRKKFGEVVCLVGIAACSLCVKDLKAEVVDDGGRGLGFRMLGEMLKGQNKDKNVLVSPYSIRTAFAMLQAGAKGETAEELERVLVQDRDALSRTVDYTRLSEGSKGSTVLSANSVWYDHGWPVNEEYMSKVDRFCKGLVRPHDFHAVGWPEPINKFVGDNTRGMIKGVFDPNSKPASADEEWMVLVNTLYFKGIWLNEFEKGRSVVRKFDRYGQKSDAYMMVGNKGRYLSDESSGLTGVELPFGYGKKDGYSFIAILPGTNTPESMGTALSKLAGDGLDALFESSPAYDELVIKIPRLDMGFDVKLRQILSDMGMKTAMGNSPDYTGMYKPDGIHSSPKVSEVIHKTKLKLDEKGAEAAAATAIRMKCVKCCMEMPRPKTIARFYADRPYIVVIYDNVRHIVLFVGVVMNPGCHGERPRCVDSDTAPNGISSKGSGKFEML